VTTHSRIAMLIYGMTNAVLFGIGAVATVVLADEEQWKYLLPAVVVLSILLAAPVAWLIAPRLRARYWRDPPAEVPH
jgi:hypothetical protein